MYRYACIYNVAALFPLGDGGCNMTDSNRGDVRERCEGGTSIPILERTAQACQGWRWIVAKLAEIEIQI
jgi:hypothetical protein